jgi:hypothetical protein
VLYSHTSGGHRRQASLLCTHLSDWLQLWRLGRAGDA